MKKKNFIMNVRKRIVGTLVMLSLLCASTISVSAGECYFSNSKGLKLSEEEYYSAIKYVDETVLKVIDRTQYNYIMSTDTKEVVEDIYVKTIINRKNGEVVSELALSEDEMIDDLNYRNVPIAEKSNFAASTYAYLEEKRYDTVDTEMKHLELRMTNVGASTKTVTLTCNWIKIPQYKSYDVLGFWTGSRAVTISTIDSKNIYGVQYCNGKVQSEYTGYSNNVKKCDKGIGVSMNIVDDARFSLSMKFTVIFGTKTDPFGVRGSYQHCQKNISLSQSKRYDIQAGGMGGVFQFKDSVKSYFDNTPGLYVVGSIN